MATVHVENIKKTYEKGSVTALENVSFDVRSGELFGLIGPDGAGKTSLFRILTTLLLPDSGQARVADLDVVKDLWKIRQLVGYMPGKFSLYQDLSIEENLDFFATVFNTTLEKNYHLIEDIYVQIEPFKKRLAGKLSGGMKQKLALCCALIHEPKVLFLDEPTTGVDPVSRKEFWDMLDRLKARGITIVVSTPYMDEASRCDRIALIQKGKILELDTLDKIIARHTQNLYAVDADNRYQLMKDLRASSEIESSFAFGEEQHVTLHNPERGADYLTAYLTEHGHSHIQVRPILPNIEDIFIKLMLENQ
jgi:ABC-type multidrug transport system ATPase subunit